MKPIEKKILPNGTIQITVEQTKLWGLLNEKVVFTSNRVIVGKFRNWVREPNKLIVPDRMSFQLDEWNQQL